MDAKHLLDALRSAGRGGDPDPAQITVSYTIYPRGNVATGGEWRTESLAAHAERRIAAGAKCLPQGRKLLAPTFVGAKLRDGRRADAAAQEIHWLFFDADNVGEWDTLLSALSEAGIAHVAARSCSDGTPRSDGGDASALNVKWHLYLPLASPVVVDGPDFKSRRYTPELRHLYRALVALGGLSGCDESVDDLAQCAYIGMRPDRYAPVREVRHSGGALLDWDAALTATAYVPPVAPPRSVPGGGTGPRAASSGPRKAAPKGKQGAPGAAPAGGWDGGATVGESAGTLAYLAAKGLGLLGPQFGPHSYLILCPWRAEHSPGCPQRDRGEYHSSTVIYVGGSVSGGFTCKHAHCADKKIGDLLRLARIQGVPLPDRPEWGGASADDFETENDEPPQAATGEGSNGDEDVNATTNKKVHQNDSKSKRCPHLPAEIAAQLLRSAPTKAQMESEMPGSLKPASANVILILSHDTRWAGVLGWDEFAIRLSKRKNPPWHESQVGADSGPGEWSQSDDQRLIAWLELEYGISVSIRSVGACAAVVAKRSPFHLVKEYLTSLKWDGVPRLATWLHEYLGAEQSRYTELVGTYWAVSAVARIFKPGCKVDTTMVLEGGQGLGKGRSLRVLGGEWFADSDIDLRSKDKYQQVQGVWIYEMSELAGLDKHDDSLVKAFLSSQTDRYRAPYDSVARDWPRSVCFGGSVNPDRDKNGTYLKDPTGGRRYWPCKCFVTRSTADVDGLALVRDQLWAEAVHLFDHGAVWWPSAEDEHLFRAEQGARSVDNETDPWDATIAQWIAATHGGTRVPREADDPIALPLTPETLLSEAIYMPKDRQTRQSLLRCGKSLRRLGWRRSDKTKRVGGVACYPYVPDLDEAGTEALSELCEMAKSLSREQKEWFRNTLFGSPITAAHVASLRVAVADKLA